MLHTHNQSLQTIKEGGNQLMNKLNRFFKGKITLRNKISEARNKYPHSDLIRAKETQNRGRAWLVQKTVPELHWLKMVACSQVRRNWPLPTTSVHLLEVVIPSYGLRTDFLTKYGFCHFYHTLLSSS